VHGARTGHQVKTRAQRNEIRDNEIEDGDGWGSLLQMVRRAQFLQAAGYVALLIDLPAHGESRGTRITFGAIESSAIRATLEYLQQSAPGAKVAVVGVSLGAASLVLGGAVPVPAAVVVESMYPSLREAVAIGSRCALVRPVVFWPARSSGSFRSAWG
jgi:predicted alpha/beta hydrolase